MNNKSHIRKQNKTILNSLRIPLLLGPALFLSGLNAASAIEINNLSEACHLTNAPSSKCKSWEVYSGSDNNYKHDGKRMGLIFNVALVQGKHNKYFITQTKGDGFSRYSNAWNAEEVTTSDYGISATAYITKVTHYSYHRQFFHEKKIPNIMAYEYFPQQSNTGSVTNSVSVSIGGSFDAGGPGVSVGISAGHNTNQANFGMDVDSRQFEKRWWYHNPNAQGHGFKRAIAYPSLSALEYTANSLESSQPIATSAIWQMPNWVTTGDWYAFDTNYAWHWWFQGHSGGVPYCAPGATCEGKSGPDLHVLKWVYLNPTAVWN